MSKRKKSVTNPVDVKKYAMEPYTDPQGMKKALGRSLYQLPEDALLELVKNAMAAYQDLDETPVIHLDKTTNHSLVDPNGRALLSGVPCWTVTDFGCGFIPEILEGYAQIGKSQGRGAGVHGVGKFSAFALMENSEEDGSCFYIITRASRGGPVLVYTIGDNIFEHKTITPWVWNGVVEQNIPASETFSQIVIPNAVVWDKLKTVACKMLTHLPVSGYDMYIEGVKSELGDFDVLTALQSEEVAGFGSVHAEIGVWSLEEKGVNPFYGVIIMDPSSGNLPVLRLSDSNISKQPALLPLTNPSLCVRVFIPGIRGFVGLSHRQFNQGFWASRLGRALKAYLTDHVVVAAKTLLDKEGLSEQASFDGEFFEIGEMCARVFKPTKTEKKKKRGSGTKKEEKKKSGVSREKSKDFYVYVEGARYRLIVLPVRGNLVASQVVRGGAIAINPSAPFVKSLLLTRARHVRIQGILDLVIRAHVASKYGTLSGVDVSKRVAAISARVAART